MTTEEFNKRLDVLLSDDEISDKEIKADINNMVEALLKSKVEAITEKMKKQFNEFNNNLLKGYLEAINDFNKLLKQHYESK